MDETGKGPKPVKSTATLRNAERTREKIFLAAQAIAAEQGIEGLTTKRVCERAGVSNGTFFYHFKTKGALLSYFLQEGFDRFYEERRDELDEGVGREASEAGSPEGLAQSDSHAGDGLCEHRGELADVPGCEASDAGDSEGLAQDDSHTGDGLCERRGELGVGLGREVSDAVDSEGLARDDSHTSDGLCGNGSQLTCGALDNESPEHHVVGPASGQAAGEHAGNENAAAVKQRVIGGFVLYARYCEQTGVDFMRAYYVGSNEALDGRPESLGRPFLNQQMTDCAAALASVCGESAPEVARGCCTVVKGCVFEWCVSNGELDLANHIKETLAAYLAGALMR